MTYKRKEVIGNCTLYLGDCAEILPLIKNVDAVITDPPYGINLAGGFGGFGGFGKPIKRRRYKGEWDSKTPENQIFDLILSKSEIFIIWGGNYFTDKLPQASHWLVWDKENTMPTFSDCELAWTNLPKNNVKKFQYRQNGCMSREKERFHPTQKPIAVMQWCINQLPKDAKVICDPFLGSGTTLVAGIKAEKLGIGIEQDEDYFDIACKRIEQAYKEPTFFQEPIETFQQESFI